MLLMMVAVVGVGLCASNVGGNPPAPTEPAKTSDPAAKPDAPDALDLLAQADGLTVHALRAGWMDEVASGGGFTMSGSVSVINAGPLAAEDLATSGEPVDADFDGSGTVNVLDLHAYVRAYVAGEPTSDANHDARTDARDLYSFIGEWLRAER
jgi:hypothetical protein